MNRRQNTSSTERAWSSSSSAHSAQQHWLLLNENGRLRHTVGLGLPEAAVRRDGVLGEDGGVGRRRHVAAGHAALEGDPLVGGGESAAWHDIDG